MYKLKVCMGAVVLWLALGLFMPLMAQCPMCKANVEAAMRDPNNKVGSGLNAGILYLFVAPYLAAGIIGVLWYRNYRRVQRDNLA